MRNPLDRFVRHDPAKPTLRERAASLRATATRVICRPKPVAAASSPVDPIAIPDGIVSDDGMVSFVDAAGTMHRTSVADWIGFAAVRLNGIARREASRQYNAACNDLGPDEAADLWNRLRREHRLDAVDALAFRWRKAFETAKDCVIGHVEYVAAVDRKRRAHDAAADERLVALGKAWRIAQADYDEAWGRHDALVPLVQRPSEPEALFSRPEDVRLGIARYANERADGLLWYVWAAYPKSSGETGSLRDLHGREAPKSGAARASWAETEIRAAEICAAYDKWQADIEAAKAAIGLGQVEEETGRLGKELLRLETEIAGATATTLAGLRVKALVAQSHLEEEDDWSGLFSGLHHDVLALEEAPTVAAAVPEIDFGAASMDRLRQLYEAAEAIAEMCDGFMSQPRCESVHGRLPAPGAFVDWVTGGCDFVLDACRREAAHRRPLGNSDKRVRLAILARAALDNGDPAETAALARDFAEIV